LGECAYDDRKWLWCTGCLKVLQRYHIIFLCYHFADTPSIFLFSRLIHLTMGVIISLTVTQRILSRIIIMHWMIMCTGKDEQTKDYALNVDFHEYFLLNKSDYHHAKTWWLKSYHETNIRWERLITAVINLSHLICICTWIM